MRLDGSTPVKYGLRMNMDDKYKCIKQQISQLSNIPYTQLLLVEVFGALVKVIYIIYQILIEIYVIVKLFVRRLH